MYKITSRWPHQESVKIEWNLGKRCNFDCGYCPAEIHDNISPHTDIAILKNTVDKLTEINKPIRISFTGGEPCVHPDIEELLAYAKEHASWINVTTNATRTPEWYAKQPVSHYVFSLHYDNEHWERCAMTILLFSQLCEIPFQVNIMAHNQHMDRVRYSVDLFTGHNIGFVLRRIRWTEGDHDWFDDMRYQPNDLKYLLENNATAKENCIVDNKDLYHANDIIKLHMNKFKDWKCSAGIESLMINWDGEVHRATCRVGGSLGNIYKGDFRIPASEIICDRNWCTCAADIPLTKTSIL